MATTVASYADVMKDTWTSDRLAKQFYDKNPILDRLEKTNRYTIGNEARVPIHVGRGGGYSVKSSAGGALNGPDEPRVDKASYTLSYGWEEVEIETGTLNQAGGGAQSVGSAMELTVQSAISNIRRQAARQVAGLGNALIAQCDTTSNSTTVELHADGYGSDALSRGQLYAGLKVDIGTTADEGLRATDREITRVSKSLTDPDIVISGAAVTTDSSDYVSIANARSGTTSNETNGLRQIAASTSLPLGGLDPDTAGEEFWQPALVDTTTTTFSLDLARRLQRAVHQETGERATWLVTSLDQEDSFDALLFNQVRFTGDSQGVQTGKKMWGGLEFVGVPDIPARELYILTPEDLLVVTGKYQKPTWKSDLMGANQGLQSKQGYTSFVDEVFFAFNLGARRRNSHAAAIGLTA